MARVLKSWLAKKKLDSTSRKKIEVIEGLTGCRVCQPYLFLRALRHRSKLIETNMRHNESYEQLEFLGDAVLDLIVTEIIFEKFSTRNEGFMTQMRSRIVKGETLAKFSEYLKLAELIEVGDRVKDQGIQFSSSVLADIFEAIIGAMYKDCGYEKAAAFVRKLILENVELDLLEQKRDNYKSILLEYTQSKKMDTPVYHIESMSGPDHDRTFVIRVLLGTKAFGRGTGKNKKKAEQLAAQETLEMIMKLVDEQPKSTVSEV
ncbi:MAG: ribonuclease III [Bacteroidetes bacterium]|nr:ribonuclease III [Bacteroidota bacterium]